MGTKRSKQSQQDIDDLCKLLGACEDASRFIRRHGVTEQAWTKCNNAWWLAQLCDTVAVPWRYRLMAAALCVQAFRNDKHVAALYGDMVRIARGKSGLSLSGVEPHGNTSGIVYGLRRFLSGKPSDHTGLLFTAVDFCTFESVRVIKDADRDFSNRIRLVIPWPMVKDCIDEALAKYRAERDNAPKYANYDMRSGPIYDGALYP